MYTISRNCLASPWKHAFEYCPSRGSKCKEIGWLKEKKNTLNSEVSIEAKQCHSLLKGRKVLVVDSFQKGVSVLRLKGKLSIWKKFLRGRLSLTHFLPSLQRIYWSRENGEQEICSLAPRFLARKSLKMSLTEEINLMFHPGSGRSLGNRIWFSHLLDKEKINSEFHGVWAFGELNFHIGNFKNTWILSVSFSEVEFFI